ncbi:MAG: DUF2156 domain-containing protein, partial [Lachnospiraceae bacterium]|nr:DUF2156 domain-containing protein [Lachnospiraceae bacterium]
AEEEPEEPAEEVAEETAEEVEETAEEVAEEPAEEVEEETAEEVEEETAEEVEEETAEEVEETAEEVEETTEEVAEEAAEEEVEETTEEVEETAKVEAEEPAEEEPEEPAEEEVEETAEEVVEEPAEEEPEEPAEEVAEETAEEVVKEPAEEEPEEPAEEVAEETAEEVEETAEEVAEEPAEEEVEETTEEVVEETTEETTEEVAEETTEETTEEVAEETAEEVEEEPAEETTEEVAEETAEEVAEEVTEEPAEVAEETTEEAEHAETAETAAMVAKEEPEEASLLETATGLDLAKALVYNFPTNFAAFQALDRRSKLFESQTVKGVVPYAYVGKETIISGGPICKDEDLSTLMSEFKDMCKSKKLSIAMINVGTELTKKLEDLGFSSLRAGAEPVFDLGKLKPRNNASIKATREQIKKKYKLTIAEYKYYEAMDPDLEMRMIELSDNWLDARNPAKFTIYKRRQRDAFLPSILDFEHDLKVKCDSTINKNAPANCLRRYFYALNDAGEMKGLLVFCPLVANKAYACEAGRKASNTPKNIMELLMHEAFATFKEEGNVYASMGMFPDTEYIDKGNSRQNRWMAFLSRYYLDIYACKDYKKASQKYKPLKWEECNIVTLEYQDMRGD